MAFNFKNAVAGAGTGSALGPWGAAGGALLGGFMGPEEPELYSSQNYLKDMQPYMDGVQSQMKLGNQLMDPNSSVNRTMGQNIQKTSMDQMGLANLMSQRQNASNPYINSSGIQNQQVQNNLLSYANQGLGQFNNAMQNRFTQGMQQTNMANENLGSVYSNVASINQGNMAQMNEFDAAQNKAMMSGFGSLAGDISENANFKAGGMFGKQGDKDYIQGYLGGAEGLLGFIT
jgi:hypothetical protein